MTSFELKNHIHQSGFVYWQIAEKVGVSEMTIIRWMRGKPTEEHARLIVNAVNELKEAANHE